ncbi:UNVERIFIED_CONTAM: Kinesin-like protein NACK1 [Sesamum calycinum]|uniref:Kinesin-like protein n=1 Tax=Sesamum calycinum TaxID=2727403 RepID=A0AAW2NGN7_9LAMI
MDRTPVATPGGHRAKEEKIVVTVRLRPLNKREQLSKDQMAWECTDDNTIIYKPNPHERAALPASFTFDKVFGPDCSTEIVYEDGVKTVALSALMGINATIFAYGQTSSGKTYTMRGITEKAVNDIYMHIMNTPERDFKIKISGLEIYNENVRDLLNSESGRNLKLLDDPEKGTVVEKLVEETANDDQHLRHLIQICDAQRQVGETALNDTSSRSHQIIRLTIESTLREKLVRSYVASLNFVDLAGSERASQTNAEGGIYILKKILYTQMEREMEELRRQRDLAQSQVDELRRKLEEDSPVVKKCLSFSGTSLPKLDGRELGRCDRTRNTLGRQTMRQSSTAPFTLMHEIRKLEHLQEQLGEEASRALDVLQKEVACHKQGNQDAAETVAKLQAEIREMRTMQPAPEVVEVGSVVSVNKSVSANLKDEITRLHSQGSTIADLEEKLENVQKSIDKLVIAPVFDDAVSSETQSVSEKDTPTKSEGGDVSSKENTPYRRSSSVNMRKMQRMFQNAAEENVRSIKAYVTELKARVAKLQYQKQLLVCQVLELEANEEAGYDLEDAENAAAAQEESPASWHLTFRDQRQQLIELWDICHVSIIHRTQFYLLFKGDPADQIYVEVELRRLTWLQQHLTEIGNASPAPGGNEPAISLSSSVRALKREREFLAKRLSSRLTPEERDALYIKWEVPLDGKQRRIQFVNKLWTNPHDEKHIQESAEIVAKLVGFCEGGNMSKEMFELNFVLHLIEGTGLWVEPDIRPSSFVRIHILYLLKLHAELNFMFRSYE